MEQSNKQIGQKRQLEIVKYLTKWQYSTIKILAQNLKLKYPQIQANIQSLIKKDKINIYKFHRSGELVNVIFLTEIGIATNLKLLSSQAKNNPHVEQILTEVQAIYQTATSPEQINSTLINHNLYLQELMPQILSHLDNHDIKLQKYRTEAEQMAQHKHLIYNQLYQLESEYQILKQNGINRQEIGWKIQDKKQELQNISAKFADLLVNNSIAIEFENTRKKPRELDQMCIKYVSKSNISKVFIFSFTSLNVYRNHLNNEFHFSWKYSAKDKKYIANQKYKLTEEQKSKFIFIEV